MTWQKQLLLFCLLGLATTLLLGERSGRPFAMEGVFDADLTNAADPIPTVRAAKMLAEDSRARVYEAESEAGSLFIYPPLAALPYTWTDVTSYETLRHDLGRASQLLFFACVLICGLLAGLPLRRLARADWLGWALAFVGSLVFYPLIRSVELNQAGLFVATAVGASLLALQHERPWLAGAIYALACCVKPPLAIAAVLMFWHQRRFLWSMLTTGAALLLGSLIYAGLDNHVTYVLDVLPKVSKGYAFYPNQAFSALLLRLIPGIGIETFALAPPHPALRMVGLVFTVAIFVWAVRFVSRKVPRTAPSHVILSLSWLVSVLMSPIAWEHHFAAAIFILAIAVRSVREGDLDDQRAITLLALAGLGLAVFLDVAWLRGVLPRLLVSYNFYAALLMLSGLALWLSPSSSGRWSFLGKLAREPDEPSARDRKWIGIAEVALISVAAVVALIVSWQITLYPFGRDQGIYAVVAEQMRAGLPPYLGTWDFKPPMIFFLYGAAQTLFGETTSSIRILEVLAWLSLATAFSFTTRRCLGSRKIGLLGAVIALLVYAQQDFWHTAQPEGFGAVFLAWALAAACYAAGPGQPPKRRRALAALAGCGAACAAAAFCKPPLGGAILVFGAMLLWSKRDAFARGKDRLLALVSLALGGAVVTALTLGYFAATGALPALVETFFEFGPQYTALGFSPAALPVGFVHAALKTLLTFSALLLPGVVLAFWGCANDDEQWLLQTLGAIAAFTLLGISLQAKFFQYHFGATFALVGLMAAVGYAHWWRQCVRTPLVALGSVLLLVGLAAWKQDTPDSPLSYWKRNALRTHAALDSSASDDVTKLLYSVPTFSLNDNLAVAAWLRANTPASAPIYVWGFEPSIYFDARRRPASRFIYNAPQRAPWSKEAARSELMRDLDRAPPSAVVIERLDSFFRVVGNDSDSATALTEFPALWEYLRRHYRPAVEIGRFLVLRRSTDS